MKTNRQILIDFILMDTDFKNIYNKYSSDHNLFESSVSNFIDVIDSFDGYLLDKTYLDISYLVCNDCILDLDSIIIDYKSYLIDTRKEVYGNNSCWLNIKTKRR